MLAVTHVIVDEAQLVEDVTPEVALVHAGRVEARLNRTHGGQHGARRGVEVVGVAVPVGRLRLVLALSGRQDAATVAEIIPRQIAKEAERALAHFVAQSDVAGEALEVAGELHAVDAVRENADEEVERGKALLPIAEHDAPGHLLVAVEHAERAGFVGAERLDEVVDKGGHELALRLAVTPVGLAAPAIIPLQVGHDEAVRRVQEAAEGVFLAALESMIVTHGITF